MTYILWSSDSLTAVRTLAYILALPFLCIHPYIDLYFTVHKACCIVLLVNIIVMNFDQNVCFEHILVRFFKCYNTQVSVTGSS